LQNLHQLFVLCTANQIIGGDFLKFCGLLRIFELYEVNVEKRKNGLCVGHLLKKMKHFFSQLPPKAQWRKKRET
jgi:hypothetical protein